MMEKEQDILARAFATLSSLQKNIEKITSNPPEIFVQESHNVLTTLEGIGKDVSGFRIPDSLVKPRITVMTSNGPRYSDEKYVDKYFILTKLDAILGYFEIITSEKPRKIGFHTPESE